MGARKHNHARRHKTTRIRRVLNPYAKQNAIRSGEVAEKWDRYKTVKQNYEAMGLKPDLNTGKDIAKHAPGMLAEALGIKVEWVDLPEASEVAAALESAARNPRRAENWVSEEEITYLQLLIDKYVKSPADLEADRTYFLMARDIKANWKQHTAEHLRSRISRMHKYLAAKRAAESTDSAESAQPVADAPETTTAAADAVKTVEKEVKAVSKKNSKKSKS